MRTNLFDQLDYDWTASRQHRRPPTAWATGDPALAACSTLADVVARCRGSVPGSDAAMRALSVSRRPTRSRHERSSR